MRRSSIMRCRSGLMSWLGGGTAALLCAGGGGARRRASDEEERLLPQHRKPSGFPMKNHHVETECIPRERFRPLAGPCLSLTADKQATGFRPAIAPNRPPA